MKFWLNSFDKTLLGAAIVRRKKVRGAISYPIDTLLLIDGRKSSASIVIKIIFLFLTPMNVTSYLILRIMTTLLISRTVLLMTDST